MPHRVDLIRPCTAPSETRDAAACGTVHCSVSAGRSGDMLLAPLLVLTLASNDAIHDARVMVKRLAYEHFVDWARKHPDELCPRSVDDVLAYADFDRDPWGSEFRMYCGDDVPEPARRDFVAFSSAGPDRAHGTVDDVQSWE